MDMSQTVAIFGASGLIGEGVASGLHEVGIRTVPIARRFTAAQRGRFAGAAIEIDFIGLNRSELATFFLRHPVDVVINCVGVLQDGPSGRTQDVHVEWIARLLTAMPENALLIHLSIPGQPANDCTAFSRSKRQADVMIADSERDFVILRPGFVLAPSAYGGSALLRAIASLPIDLPKEIAATQFKMVALDDVVATIDHVIAGRRSGQRGWRYVWDVMGAEFTTVGDVVDGLRRRLGGPPPSLRLSGWIMQLGVLAGDLVSTFGWVPPVRTTSLAEMQRGVVGDPEPWMRATDIHPGSLSEVLERLPVGVQERWFGRLYLLKAMTLSTLVMFWLASGVIALTVGFPQATAVLTKSGLLEFLASPITVATALLDIVIGLGIAWRRYARASLWVGIGVSVTYLVASLILAPVLWLDPLGPMVKTVPIVVLMLIGVAILDDR